MRTRTPPASWPRRLAAFCVVVGAVAAAVWPRALGAGWLAAAFFWSGVPVGALLFLAIMALVGGRWRLSLRPAMLRGAAVLPALTVAALPPLAGMAVLYPWVADRPEGFAGAWLSPGFFALRTVAWLAGLWLLLAGLRRGGRAAVCVGLLVLVPATSLIAVDWLMSRARDFHSSGFGLQMLSTQMTVALMVAAIVAVRRRPDRSGTVGALMLTLLLFWGYFAYLPFFIVWSGNTPAGAAWYLARARNGWGAVATLAVALHIIPLAALLFGPVRRSARGLTACAVSALAGDAAYAAWLVLPADGPLLSPPLLAYVLALALIGAATLLPFLLRGRRA